METRRIAIIGSGYVGLVSGACFAELGHTVSCVDIDEARIEGLRHGKAPFYEPGIEELLARNASTGQLTFTTEYAEGVRNAEFIFLCVQTPPAANGAADTSILRGVLSRLATLLEPPYPVIVVKSTAPIGTSEGFSRTLARERPALEAVPFVSNPEFLREGSAIRDFMRPDRVVVGSGDAGAADRVAALYEPLGAPIVRGDAATAEMIKYASNAFLATKISFINEMADICERVGADISKVSEGMGLDPRIGPSFLRPGVGYGGSCFPKDILALAHTAAIHGGDARILRAVMGVNTYQFKRVLHKLRDQLETLDGTTVAVWGIAYKPHTDDVREAPAVEIMRLLEQEGAHVRAYDPIAMPRAEPLLPGVRMCRDMYAAAEGADAVLLLTEWEEFARAELGRVAAAMRTPVLIDGRNVVDPAAAQAAGLTYIGVGRAPVVRRRAGYSLPAGTQQPAGVPAR